VPSLTAQAIIYYIFRQLNSAGENYIFPQLSCRIPTAHFLAWVVAIGNQTGKQTVLSVVIKRYHTT